VGSSTRNGGCFVDNVSFGSKVPSYGVLTDGLHFFRLEAKVAKEQTFWFDFLNYIPSSSVPLDTSTVFYDQSDSTVQCGSGWTEAQWHYTQQTGAKATIQFSGLSVSSSEISLTEYNSHRDISDVVRSATYWLTTATYFIDGQTPISFSVDGLGGSVIHHNVPIFNTGQPSPGSHTLEVGHQGSPTTAPLTLGHYPVQNLRV